MTASPNEVLKTRASPPTSDTAATQPHKIQGERAEDLKDLTDAADHQPCDQRRRRHEARRACPSDKRRQHKAAAKSSDGLDY